MKDINWELIAKHLAKETNSQENELVEKLLQNDITFSKEYESIEKIWNSISIKNRDIDKIRIYKLIEREINKSQINNKLRNLIKYAAILIGLLIIIGGFYSDFTRTKTIVANGNSIKTYILPDGSTINMQKNTEISFSNSRLLSFNRKVSIKKGEAFFEITKDKDGKGFTVVTPDYNINVLGTKFDVNCKSQQTDIVLAEGKVMLDDFDKEEYNNILLAPGDMISYSVGSERPKIKHVNPNIYSIWVKNKLEYNRFSINELSDFFKVYFNKTIVLKDKEIGNKRIGGTAPADDLDLILKGISDVLHLKITQKNDLIIIE